MAKRYTVGIDADGVVADFTGAARRTMKALWGKPSDDLVQTTWAFDSLGITSDEEKEFWRYVDFARNWWLSLKPMPHTLCLDELVRNHRCVFITNRKDGKNSWPIEEQTAEWLKFTFGLSNPNVVISDNKGPVSLGLNLDYFIDDRPKNIEDVWAVNRECRTYLCEATYNGSFNYPQRVAHFDDFARLIIARANGRGN